jgi:cellulose synthase/poly-beta-1,6-N-acetylglucosamine synthase-like glycosyltransferase
MMPDQLRKWLRQQSRDFYTSGFDALVKRWDKCTNVGRGYVGKYIFFPRFEYHMFLFLYPFVTYFLTLPPTCTHTNDTNIFFNCECYTELNGEIIKNVNSSMVFPHLTVDNEGEFGTVYARIFNRTGNPQNISITHMCWVVTL